MKVLKLFTILNTNFCKYLANLDWFLVLIMELMLLDKEVLKSSLSILEGLIILNPGLITAEHFPLLKRSYLRDICDTKSGYSLFEKMGLKQLARFSRVLAHFFVENSEKLVRAMRTI